MYFVYLLECRGGSLYTGIARDVAKRFAAHQTGKGAKYTRAHPPERIALTLTCADRSVALKLEYAIKQLAPTDKRRWLQGDFVRAPAKLYQDADAVWQAQAIST